MTTAKSEQRKEPELPVASAWHTGTVMHHTVPCAASGVYTMSVFAMWVIMVVSAASASSMSVRCFCVLSRRVAAVSSWSSIAWSTCGIPVRWGSSEAYGSTRKAWRTVAESIEIHLWGRCKASQLLQLRRSAMPDSESMSRSFFAPWRLTRTSPFSPGYARRAATWYASWKFTARGWWGPLDQVVPSSSQLLQFCLRPLAL